MRFFARSLLPIMFVLMVAACNDQQSPTAQQQPERADFIIAANTPLQYFAQRMLGNDIEVRLLAPKGSDPAQWQPSVDEVLQLQQAKLILLNGAGYWGWLNKVSVADSALVNTSAKVRQQWLALEDQLSHSHGPTGEHAHGGYAFTIWMDMSLAQAQAKAIAHALGQRWPEKKGSIDRELDALLADLGALDEGFMAVATRLQGRQLIYSHPVYQYFERRYELPGVSLHWEPDLMPNDEQWRELQRLNIEDTLFIWEAKPAAEIADRMRQLGIEYVILNPAANHREDDWITVQRNNLVRLSTI